MKTITLKPVVVVRAEDCFGSPLWELNLVSGVSKHYVPFGQIVNPSEFARTVQFTQDDLEVDSDAAIVNIASLTALSAMAANEAIANYDFDGNYSGCLVHLGFVESK